MVTATESTLHELFNALQADLDPSRCQSFAATRLRDRMRKRARLGGADPDDAKQSFLCVNLSLEGFQHRLDASIVSEAASFIRHALERFTARLDPNFIQGTIKWSYLLDNWRFGPGASHDVLGTHTADKIFEVMTCTEKCEPLVRILRTSNPYFRAYDSLSGSVGVKVLRGSKLATVPKNEDTERTIAIEPSGNMCLQLAAGAYLEESLRLVGLDIKKQQPKNKALARRGSIDGSIATIDLKSASDMISLDLVRALLPREWFGLLDMLRSPEILIDGEYFPLHMISTMGNGFTFPLMTLIITSLVYANRRVRGGPVNFIDWSSTAVFGDDIIIPSQEYESLVKILDEAGLVVNHDKSFSTGSFRESCGGDFYNGEDVTPFYVKDLTTQAEVYTAINQVLEWSARHHVLWNTLNFLYSICIVPRYVPEWSNPDSGIKTSQCPRRYTFLRPRPQYKILRRNFEAIFAVALCAGGYVTYRNNNVCFVPRAKRTKYDVVKSRVPRGHLDGRCGVSRDAGVSRTVDFILSAYR